MGCITGFVAKIFLVAFNAAVALTGVCVLALGALTTVILVNYADLIPSEPHAILTALQTLSGFVICLGGLGVLTVCCCHNKLFMYVYSGLGICLVIATLTVSGIGVSNLNSKYKEDTLALMITDLNTYDLNNHSEYETSQDQIYFQNKCCGVLTYKEWADVPTNNFLKTKLPYGCCEDYSSSASSCTTTSGNFFIDGCYKKLDSDVTDLAEATAKLAIFFGVLLLALITSTCVCVKCTDALPL